MFPGCGAMPARIAGTAPARALWCARSGRLPTACWRSSARIRRRLRERHRTTSKPRSRVLGAVFIKPAAFDEVATNLQVDDFFLPAHREIFESMLAIDKRRQAIDVIAVADELRTHGMLARLDGGEAYLRRWPTRVPTAENVLHYARLVREKATLRRLIAACAEVQSTRLRRLRRVRDLPRRGRDQDLQGRAAEPARDLLRDRRPDGGGAAQPGGAHRRTARRDRRARPASPSWTRCTAGLQRENLIIVAARPGGGKTSWAVNVAMNAALHHKIPVLLFSLEMSKYELMERMLAGEARIDSSRIKRGFLEYADWKNKIHPASGRLAAAPILIDDSSAISIMEIRAKARRFRGDPRYFPPPADPPMAAAAASAAGADRRRLLAARARQRRPPRREPPAGDRRDLARAQGAGQGSEGADHRASRS